MQRRVGLSGSKKETVGADVSACLVVLNAWSRSGDRLNSFFVLNNGRKCANRLASVAVLDESWFARPRKARRSVRFAGVGKLETASVIDLSTQ